MRLLEGLLTVALLIGFLIKGPEHVMAKGCLFGGVVFVKGKSWVTCCNLVLYTHNFVNEFLLSNASWVETIKNN